VGNYSNNELQFKVIGLNHFSNECTLSHASFALIWIGKKGLENNVRVMTKAVCTSETSVYFNETTLCYIPEGSHLHFRRRENLKSAITELLSTHLFAETVE
jgi:hypothetical protein